MDAEEKQIDTFEMFYCFLTFQGIELRNQNKKTAGFDAGG